MQKYGATLIFTSETEYDLTAQNTRNPVSYCKHFEVTFEKFSLCKCSLQSILSKMQS